MLELIKLAIEWLKKRSGDDMARIVAHLLAPAFVLGLTLLGSFGEVLSLGSPRAITISELKTEMSPSGDSKSKPGIAIIVEPITSEYRIPLSGGVSKMWSSLDEEEARANNDHLVLDAAGLNGRTPLVGVNEPVMVVLEGNIGKEIQVPGGREKIDDWRLESRKSLSLVSGVLLSCVFAFGVSLAKGFPSADGNEKTGS
jgi:hypothetical protein